MDLPRCRNFKEKSCERSEQVLLKETEEFWEFYCKCCQSSWIVTKPRTKARAQLEVQAARIQRATDIDRERARRRYFT